MVHSLIAKPASSGVSSPTQLIASLTTFVWKDENAGGPNSNTYTYTTSEEGLTSAEAWKRLQEETIAADKEFQNLTNMGEELEKSMTQMAKNFEESFREFMKPRFFESWW